MLIITNNENVIRHIEKSKVEYRYIKGHALDVLHYTKELVLDGYRLAADPLAGHYERLNPYHTVFVERDLREKEKDFYDLGRIEKSENRWKTHGHDIRPMTPLMEEQYRGLDESIAINIFSSLC